MDFEGALRARLTNAAAVTAIVGTRVYWVDRPQATALPAITLQKVGELRPQHFEGFDGLNPSTVQVDCWAESYGQAQATKEAVIAALVPTNQSNGVRFQRAEVGAIRDLGERVETKFIHRASLDLIFHYSAA